MTLGMTVSFSVAGKSLVAIVMRSYFRKELYNANKFSWRIALGS